MLMTFKKHYFFMLLSIFLFGNCILPRYINFDREMFNENYNKWKSQNIENYSFIYSSHGFAPYSIKFEVNDGEVVSVVSEDEYPYHIEDEGRTIDTCFDEILNFYNDRNGKIYSSWEMYYTDIVVEYNQNYGYPESWYYIFYCPESLAVDGNFSRAITDFDSTIEKF